MRTELNPHHYPRCPWEQQGDERHMCRVPTMQDVRGTVGGEGMRDYLRRWFCVREAVSISSMP